MEEKRKKEHIRIKRITSLDALRGFAIVCMIFFHGFQSFEGDLTSFANSVSSNPIAKVLEFMGRMAGIFVLISGFSNTMSIYSRYSKKKTNSKQVIIESIIVGLWLIVIERIVLRLIEVPIQGGGIYDFGEGPVYYSLILGYLETGQVQPFYFYGAFFSSGALSMMGLSLILYGILLTILFRKEGYKKNHRNFLILGSLATIVIIISPILIQVLRPIWVQALLDGNYAKAIFIGFLVGDTHPLLPFFGYALYGAMFGLAFKSGVSGIKVLFFGLITGIIYIILGVVEYILLGEPPMEHILRTLPIQTTHLQIGVMILIVALMYYRETEIKPRKNNNQQSNFSKILQLFGIFSLTAYLTESFVSYSIKLLILDKIFPGWAQNMIWIVFYSFFNLGLWIIIMFYWIKKEHIGSFEWITIKIKGWVRKLTSKSNFIDVEKGSLVHIK